MPNRAMILSGDQGQSEGIVLRAHVKAMTGVNTLVTSGPALRLPFAASLGRDYCSLISRPVKGILPELTVLSASTNLFQKLLLNLCALLQPPF